MPELPQRLRLQFLGLIGEEVRPWLDDLPGLVERLCRAWDVALWGTPDHGWSSYVALGARRGEPVVFKVSPKLAEGRAEIAGLLARDGVGVPPILCYDRQSGALLMPRVEPGRPAPRLDGRAVADLLRRLHIPVEPPPADVPALGEALRRRWKRRATLNSGLARPLPKTLIVDAAATVAQLAASWSPQVLLHGDFEPTNILQSSAGLIAVDSPAVMGDPGYDAASWALANDDGDDALGTRIAAIAQALDYPQERLRRWAWTLAVEGLLDKLHEPGWAPEAVEEAFAIARLLASHAAPRWRGI